MSRLLTGLLMTGLLLGLAGSATAAVVINELAYHPAGVDPDTEFLELHNTGGTSVDLDGWCIDGIGICFEAGDSIAAGGYLVLARDAAEFLATYGFAADYEYAGELGNEGDVLILENASLVAVDEVAYAHLAPWPVTPDGLGPSLELIDASLDNNTPRNWAASTDVAGHTAGAANSVAATGLPPWISLVQHGSVAPVTPIGVTAFVEDATSVDLIYLLDFGSEVTISMLDDGLSGDGAAGDGTYGASIPGQPIDTLVRYRIEAVGSTGQMDHPRVDDTINYRGTVVVDPALASDLPIFHWYIDPVDFQAAIDHRQTEETEPAVLFYDGVLYDNIQIRVRGHSAREFPKKHWKFMFPQGNEFSAPGLITNSVDRLDLQGNYADKSHLREILSYETYEDAGIPSLETFHVRVEQNGAFFGLYTYLEHPDKDWVERMGLSQDAARYKAFGDCTTLSLITLPVYYEKFSRLYENHSDLQQLLIGVNSVPGPARRDFIFDNIDIPTQINYMAATILVHNNDHVGKNYYLYRDTTGTQRWTMFPYDQDLTFGRNYDGDVLNDQIWADVDSISGRTNVSPSHPLFGDQTHQKWDYTYNRCIDAYLAEPEFREMFFRRLRTLMDELLVASEYETRIDELTPEIDSGSTGDEFEQDRTKWGQYGTSQTLATAVGLVKSSYLAPRRTHLFTTHRVSGEIPEAQSSSPAVLIHEIMYNPTGGPTHEFVELYNPSVSEAVDLSGWTLEGTGLSIPPGTVILPVGYLILARNDLAFRTEYGGGLFLPGEYPANLDNAGTSLVLRDGLGVEVDRVDYGDSVPWPSTPDGGGPSLELIDATLDNNDASNWAASLTAGGSPGEANSVSIPGGPPPELRINEVVPLNASINQDEMGDYDGWIEIYNASPSSVDLGGMFLSENADPNDPKWTFPASTPICSGCFVLVWADNEPGEGPLHATFTLGAGGGSVYLFRSDLVEIDSLTYPALATDVAYGRFPNGGLHLQELYAATPAAANQIAPVFVILNEYNGVSSSNFLANAGSDSYWGTVLGNGGDWFELVVTGDHVDMRGWDLVITNETGSPSETTEILTLTTDSIWSDLRAGTIITVSEVLADDVSYAPDLVTGDFWINVKAADGASGSYITASNFPASNDNWQLSIRDDLDQVVFGPAGEGVNPTSGVGSDEVFKLEEDPHAQISPYSNYNAGTSSTFGSPNVYSAGTTTQDFSDLRFPDQDGDGYVDVVETDTRVFVSLLNTGTDPTDPDTDDDGLLDGVETNTGIYVGPEDTGTHPLVADTDGDGLLDGVETNTDIFVDTDDTGSDPHVADSDGDGFDDGEEVDAGTNPNNALSFPIAVPGLSPLGMLLCGMVLLLAYWLVLGRGVVAPR